MLHAATTTCELFNGKFTTKNKKVKHHCHHIGTYCNTGNLKLKYKKDSNADETDEKKKKASKRKQTKLFYGTFRKFIKKQKTSLEILTTLIPLTT